MGDIQKLQGKKKPLESKVYSLGAPTDSFAQSKSSGLKGNAFKVSALATGGQRTRQSPSGNRLNDTLQVATGFEKSQDVTVGAIVA